MRAKEQFTNRKKQIVEEVLAHLQEARHKGRSRPNQPHLNSHNNLKQLLSQRKSKQRLLIRCLRVALTRQLPICSTLAVPQRHHNKHPRIQVHQLVSEMNGEMTGPILTRHPNRQHSLNNNSHHSSSRWCRRSNLLFSRCRYSSHLRLRLSPSHRRRQVSLMTSFRIPHLHNNHKMRHQRSQRGSCRTRPASCPTPWCRNKQATILSTSWCKEAITTQLWEERKAVARAWCRATQWEPVCHLKCSSHKDRTLNKCKWCSNKWWWCNSKCSVWTCKAARIHKIKWTCSRCSNRWWECNRWWTRWWCKVEDNSLNPVWVWCRTLAAGCPAWCRPNSSNNSQVWWATSLALLSNREEVRAACQVCRRPLSQMTA